MSKPESMRRQITVAYLKFAAASTLFFAIIAAVAVEGIEVRLVDERLEEVASWASPRYAGKLPVEMPAGISFHHGAGIPRSLRGLPDGVQEIEVDGVDLHVLKGHDGLGEFVVVDHDSDYEQIELVVYSMFGVAFLGFLGCSLMLGRYVGNRVVNPIVELAQAVDRRASRLPMGERADELGLLSRTIAGHTGELRQFLDRERFFTGDVSHELRTPLTVIAGAAEVLMAQTEREPALYAPAERIYRAAREATDVTSMLLRLARAPDQLEWAGMSAAALARAEVARYQPLVVGRPLALTYTGGDDFTIHGVRELVLAAIGNLVRNACQYTERGTVEVSLSGRAVIVEDTGPGLPAAARARLNNEPIPADARGSSGTGLGLGLVQRICAHLGATLALRERAAGTRFEIHFPEELTST
ncbi:sensor histidine kinase [Pseudoduganella plicata]|uniref:histidine kinase n=1 Tax=Pseudoduganella plicata TaxID=321984 RepID=A0A4P7BIG5_9BURK|nr:HAMP domain-containing sensor histidine kinase [Pseudoduganella plicata]QBQ38180.1 HAMP domain-containing histidine kinase [Pseudoduganella plicata]GGZ11374.1 two-component sensor histidine kinase [Pseudoduganella plicata]